MRIIDSFPYFNEEELLELRINLLYNKVDKFIICDANKTHKGDNKEFTCKDTLKKLNLLSDKIEVIEVDLPSYDEDSNAWTRERMQRNSVSDYIMNDDICIISDCDEIINPDLIDYYVSVVKKYPQNILRIPLAFLTKRADLRVYDLNNNPIDWSAAYFCMKMHLNDYTPSQIRESYALSLNNIKYSDIFITDNDIVQDAGWHFSWMGDENRLNIKSKSFLHWNEISLKENYVAKENSTDPLGRENHILKKYPINCLPSKIFEIERVKNFLLPTIENESRIIYKNILHINSNHQVVFDYLESKFNKEERNYRIIDVGAGENPWAIDWLTHIADNFIDPKNYNKFNNKVEIFKVDINDPREWNCILDDVEKNGKFDFVICSHTLEDINNPKISCEMLNKIGKSGYISMPSKYAEMAVFEFKSNCGLPYKGYHHHRWIYQIKNDTLIGVPKMNFHDYIQFKFDIAKGIGTEICFIWENGFNYEFIEPHQLLDNRIGKNRLNEIFEDDDLTQNFLSIKKSKIYFKPYYGYGDWLSVNGMIRFLSKNYSEVNLIVDGSEDINFISNLYRDILNINLIYQNQITEFSLSLYDYLDLQIWDQFENDKKNIYNRFNPIGKQFNFDHYKLNDSCYQRTESPHNFNNNCKSILENNASSFYVAAGIPKEIRLNEFYYERDCQSENNFFSQLNPPEDYVVVCDYGSNLINKNYIKHKNFYVININNISQKYFDVIKIIENAKEVHLIENSIALLVYHLQYKNLMKNVPINIHTYARKEPCRRCISPDNSNVYLDMLLCPKLENWNFIYLENI